MDCGSNYCIFGWRFCNKNLLWLLVNVPLFLIISLLVNVSYYRGEEHEDKKGILYGGSVRTSPRSLKGPHAS
jgi:hypothetical protein